MLILFSNPSAAQPDRDSSVNITVYGACIQCKERIEKAVRAKGIRSAIWSEESKLLSLVFRPSMISL